MKKIYVWITAIVIFPLLTSSAAAELSYYVSPHGSDLTGDGSFENPWATIYKAKEAVRIHISAGLSENIIVNFRNGTYVLDETVAFTVQDSGAAPYSIVYRSYPGEYALFSGGFPLQGWTEESGGKWSVILPEAASGQRWFRQLWINNKRCIRSRWPNAGQLETIKNVSGDKKDITLYSNIPGDNYVNAKTEIVTYHQWSCGKSLLAAKPSSDTVRCQVMPGSEGLDKLEPKQYYQAYLEHHPDFIDESTEWYLDRNTGKLTWLAPPGINPNQEQMVASDLKKLIAIEGQPGSPIKNILFLNLGFAHTCVPLPDFGYGGLQAGHYGPSYASGPHYILPFSIEMKYADSLIFSSCNFHNMGTGGIAVGIGSQFIQIKESTFYDIGCTPIMTGWRGSEDGSIQNCGSNLFMNDWSDLNSRPRYCSVRNNYIHDIAADFSGCVALWDGFSLATTMNNNYIHSAPYSGINVGFTWNTQNISLQSPMVRNNYVAEVMRILNDGGAIYHLGNSAGGMIKDNIIHDVMAGAKESMSHINFGYYFDQGSTNVTLQNNAAWNISGECLYISQKAGIVTVNPGNLCDPEPLPEDLIANAGLVPQVSEFSAELSSDCRNVFLTGNTQAWAAINYLKCMESNHSYEHLVRIYPNGQFTAQIPVSRLKSGRNTFQVQTGSPDGKCSAAVNAQITIFKELYCDDKLDFRDLSVMATNWNFFNHHLQSGLIGRWSFDETSGNLALDSSGNNHHAAVSGAARISGIGGGALAFSGSGCVELPGTALNEVQEQITAVFWQKGAVSQPAQQSIFAAQNTVGNRVLNIHLPWDNEVVYWDAGTIGTSYDRLTKTAFPDTYKDRWNHWAFTKNANTSSMKIYLNGELWTSKSGTSRSMSGITSACIGAYREGALPYEGAIDEFRIYNRELSAQEIQLLYTKNELYSEYPQEDITGDYSVNFDDLIECVKNWLQKQPGSL